MRLSSRLPPGPRGDLVLGNMRSFDRRHRTIMNPAFHKRRVTAYANLMIDNIDRAMRRWPTGRPVRIFEEVRAITLELEIVARTIFGVEMVRLRRVSVDSCESPPV